MIPKIIHQTWKNEEIPFDMLPFVNRVKELNPDWEYKLWTDDKCTELVENEFPYFLEIYARFPKNIMRADAIRYLIMYKEGGVYLDLDYEVLKPFSFGAHKVILPYNRQTKLGDAYDSIGNCFFASEPGHPFWLDAINTLKEGSTPEVNSIPKNSTIEEETTGPAFLTRIFLQKKYSDIYSPDRPVYHPRTPLSKKEEDKIKNNGVSLGIHHCWGSWRTKSKTKYFISKIKRTLQPILMANK